MGDVTSGPIRLTFNPQLRVEFRGATVTSDAGLLLPRELDEHLGLSALIERQMCRLVLPLAIQSSSLTSLQPRLFKTDGRLIRHARYFVLQLAESYLTSTLFRQILGRIARFGWLFHTSGTAGWSACGMLGVTGGRRNWLHIGNPALHRRSLCHCCAATHLATQGVS